MVICYRSSGKLRVRNQKVIVFFWNRYLFDFIDKSWRIKKKNFVIQFMYSAPQCDFQMYKFIVFWWGQFRHIWWMLVLGHGLCRKLKTTCSWFSDPQWLPWISLANLSSLTSGLPSCSSSTVSWWINSLAYSINHSFHNEVLIIVSKA